MRSWLSDTVHVRETKMKESNGDEENGSHLKKDRDKGH